MNISNIIDLIKDKSGVIKFLLDTIMKSDTTTKNLRKHADGEDPKIKMLMQVVANQNVQIKKMSTILLVYSQSDSFTTDVAKMAIKMGQGDEALQAMMENKFGKQ